MPNVRAVIRARTLTPPHNGKQAESRCSAARAYALRALGLWVSLPNLGAGSEASCLASVLQCTGAGQDARHQCTELHACMLMLSKIMPVGLCLQRRCLHACLQREVRSFLERLRWQPVPALLADVAILTRSLRFVAADVLECRGGVCQVARCHTLLALRSTGRDIGVGRSRVLQSARPQRCALTRPALAAQHDFDVAVGMAEAEEPADSEAAAACPASGRKSGGRGSGAPALVQKSKGAPGQRTHGKGAGKAGLQAGGKARPVKKDMNWRKGRGVFR